MESLLERHLGTSLDFKVDVVRVQFFHYEVEIGLVFGILILIRTLNEICLCQLAFSLKHDLE